MISRRRLLQVLAVPAFEKQGIRSRLVGDVNGTTLHVLEAGFSDGARRPAVMLLHGFPELAFSWRKVLPALAGAGFHAIAPDLRGYGRSTGAGVGFDDDLRPFRTFNEVKDVVSLVRTLGYEKAAVVGHDFGSPLAAACAVMHPEVFTRVVLMSAPYGGASGGDRVYEELSALQPPRKHYQKYFSTREANENMWHAKQGLHAFLRAYYHMKSADWKQNRPFALRAWSAAELAKLPRYYVMDRDKGMAETVAAEMPSTAEIARCKWLREDELRVYAEEYGRTGFQGGLNRYRVRWIPELNTEMRAFAGRTIDIPAMFIAGASDWGIHQRPGALEAMQKTACTKFEGLHLVEGAGHWVQQEQPDAVNRLLAGFLGK
ncbi:MAG: alpha/beta hydrolase [Acidobacteria bacterium]|nr:alpha/beta hydrolase [Acidobacteriota bacterium]